MITTAASGLAEALRYERDLATASSAVARRRVALAVGLSVAIHATGLAGLAVGGLFQAEAPERLPLTARLVRFEPLAAGAVSERAPAPRLRRQPPARLPDGVEAALSSSRSPAGVPVEAPAIEPKPEPVPLPDAAQAAPVLPEPPPVPAPEPPRPVVEPTAVVASVEPIKFPQRIDLEYNVMKGGGGGLVGRVQHRFERDGAKYAIRSTTVPVGIGALFGSGSFVMESRGAITSTGLRPDRFAVQRGRADRTEAVDFDWPAAKAVLSSGSETRELALRPGAQDLLSILHQLSFMVGDANPPLVAVTTARRFDFVRIQAAEKTTIQTDLGPVPAMRMKNLASENALRMEVWIAPDYGNIPVKILIRDNRGEEVEQILARMQVQ